MSFNFILVLLDFSSYLVSNLLAQNVIDVNLDGFRLDERDGERETECKDDELCYFQCQG